MADHFLERLREVEKKQQEDAKKQQELSQKISPTFGGRFKTSLNPEFVKQIEEIELLRHIRKMFHFCAKVKI